MTKKVLLSMALVALALTGCSKETPSESPEADGTECQPDETRPSDDGCNTCSCRKGKWVCTLMACSKSNPAITGEDAPSDDETAGGEPAEAAAPADAEADNGAEEKAPSGSDSSCTDGETKTADDGCNQCSCRKGMWACTKRGCPKK